MTGASSPDCARPATRCAWWSSAGTHPLADATARDAARAAWHSIAHDSRPIIDGLALPAFVGLDDALHATRMRSA